MSRTLQRAMWTALRVVGASWASNSVEAQGYGHGGFGRGGDTHGDMTEGVIGPADQFMAALIMVGMATAAMGMEGSATEDRTRAFTTTVGTDRAVIITADPIAAGIARADITTVDPIVPATATVGTDTNLPR